MSNAPSLKNLTYGQQPLYVTQIARFHDFLRTLYLAAVYEQTPPLAQSLALRLKAKLPPRRNSIT